MEIGWKMDAVSSRLSASLQVAAADTEVFVVTMVTREKPKASALALGFSCAVSKI